MRKKLFSDPSFWSILIMNIFFMFYYYKHPQGLGTIIFIFYLQSVFIGFFNFLNLLTLNKTVENSFTVNDQPGNKKGCAAFFFLFHYGFFHLVYLVFLVIGPSKIADLDIKFIILSFWIILFSEGYHFVKIRIRSNKEEANIGTMFFLPYARIIPMHLLILAPTFLNIPPSIVFLGLKTFADILMYYLNQNFIFPKKD